MNLWSVVLLEHPGNARAFPRLLEMPFPWPWPSGLRANSGSLCTCSLAQAPPVCVLRAFLQALHVFFIMNHRVETKASGAPSAGHLGLVLEVWAPGRGRHGRHGCVLF